MQRERSSAETIPTKYRPDIDGLSAVAVLSVIAFHMSKKAPSRWLSCVLTHLSFCLDT